MNEREQIVFKKINKILQQESSEEKLIGIMYGAGHMNTISRYLIDKLNYVPRNGKFMKVFDRSCLRLFFKFAANSLIPNTSAILRHRSFAGWPETIFGQE